MGRKRKNNGPKASSIPTSLHGHGRTPLSHLTLCSWSNKTTLKNEEEGSPSYRKPRSDPSLSPSPNPKPRTLTCSVQVGEVRDIASQETHSTYLTNGDLHVLANIHNEARSSVLEDCLGWS